MNIIICGELQEESYPAVAFCDIIVCTSGFYTVDMWAFGTSQRLSVAWRGYRMIVLKILGIILLILTLLIGLTVIIFNIPGTFIIVGAAFVYGLATKFHEINIATLLLLLGIAVFGELVEFVSGMYGAKKFGASKLGMTSALIIGLGGGICGTIVCPFVGTVVGALLGAFCGAFVVEKLLKKEMVPSLRAGFGGFIGRLGGTFIKLVLGIIMVGIVLGRILSVRVP